MTAGPAIRLQYAAVRPHAYSNPPTVHRDKLTTTVGEAGDPRMARVCRDVDERAEIDRRVANRASLKDTVVSRAPCFRDSRITVALQAYFEPGS